MKSFLGLFFILPALGIMACSTVGPGSDTGPSEISCPSGTVRDCQGVCDGTAEEDCAGVCGGIATQDCAGMCEGTATEDCAGVCEGTATEDCAGVCEGTATEDCHGVCEGTATEDCAGACGGAAIEDCAGVCEGSAIEDCEGVCNGSATDDCTGKCNGEIVEDCAGVCGGTSVEDCAGVCNGPAIEDCEGVCDGTAVIDACGDCSDGSTLACCPTPVMTHGGVNDYTGTDESYINLESDIRFDDAFSFTGWVRFNQWTGSFNRVFDFGRNDSYFNQSMRLHRNGGSTFRMAFNDWNKLDVPNYWVLDTFIFVTVTVDSSGFWTIYKDGVVVGSQTVAQCSNISWAETPNYFVAKSNWVGAEPNSNLSVYNLQWFDSVITPQCIAALYQDTP